MAQTDVKTTELDDKAREFTYHVDIDAPYDGQIIYLNLKADWAHEIVDGNARLNAGELDLTIKIDGAAQPGYDPWNIVVGSVQEQAPTGTGPSSIPKTGQLLIEIDLTTAMTPPEKFKFELRCRVTKDNL
jgi:hypothetical protein